MVKLGQKVRDTVTGFQGVATARIEYLNGCVRMCVTPPVDKDGKMVEGVYIDVESLEAVAPGFAKEPVVKRTGGERGDNPPKTYGG